MRFRWALGLLSLLAGCVNNYEQFYQNESNRVSGWIMPTATQPLEIYTASGDWVRDERRMFELGYARIGSAGFTGELAGEDALRQQAMAVGADAVVTKNSYLGSTTASIPITTTTPVTTYSSGSASAYGAGGYASGIYSGSSTTYIPTTTYVPVTTHRYDQGALFFRKMKPSCVGVLTDSPDDARRRAIGTYQGVMVVAVREQSPAWAANIFPGDVILSIGGEPMTMSSSINVSTNQSVDFEIWRDGKRMVRTLRGGACG